MYYIHKIVIENVTGGVAWWRVDQDVPLQQRGNTEKHSWCGNPPVTAMTLPCRLAIVIHSLSCTPRMVNLFAWCTNRLVLCYQRTLRPSDGSYQCEVFNIEYLPHTYKDVPFDLDRGCRTQTWKRKVPTDELIRGTKSMQVLHQERSQMDARISRVNVVGRDVVLQPCREGATSHSKCTVVLPSDAVIVLLLSLCSYWFAPRSVLYMSHACSLPQSYPSLLD